MGTEELRLLAYNIHRSNRSRWWGERPPTTWTDYYDECCKPEDEVPPWGDIQAEEVGDAGRQLSSSYNTNAFPSAGPAVPKAKRKPNRASAKGSQSPETGG